MTGKQEFGDYQTPIEFADIVCNYLRIQKQIKPDVIIEPTCGVGNFLQSSLSFHADSYYGIEISPTYCEYCKNRINDRRVHIINHDLFTFQPKKLVGAESNVLIIGNPPWATNSMLSSYHSKNLPQKVNLKGLKGIEALTGSSNFDICEYIILRLIHDFRDTDAVVSMLCKTSVARNVFKELKRNGIGFEYVELLEFDAMQVFGANTNACVLILKLSKDHDSPDICNVYSLGDYKKPRYSFGYVHDRFVSNIRMGVYDFDGTCCFQWRQGVKHDCAKVMELSMENGVLYNGERERICIENSLLFPLVKSSMFKKPVIHSFSKYVLVTQRRIGEETSYIKETAPKTWKYLSDHVEAFRSRKSSIYRNVPDFSMFGIGDYSYSRFKVGVSGFYKKPLFSLLYSTENKPVMTDDTSYFIGFDCFDMAYVAMLILNSSPVQDFLRSIVFLDAKRPYTKKVLDRLCFRKILSVVRLQELEKTEIMLGLEPHITQEMYRDFEVLSVSLEDEQITLPLSV